jgi:hypothetical protein
MGLSGVVKAAKTAKYLASSCGWRVIVLTATPKQFQAKQNHYQVSLKERSSNPYNHVCIFLIQQSNGGKLLWQQPKQ